MLHNDTCHLLCQTEPIPKEDAQFINERIADDYAINWVIDGLPAAHENTDEHTGETYYNIGFSLGYVEGNGVAALNNHYEITIYYHERPDGKHRVVGVVVYPYSKDWKLDKDGKVDCDKRSLAFHLKEDGQSRVIYTYSVNWKVNLICPSLLLLLLLLLRK